MSIPIYLSTVYLIIITHRLSLCYARDITFKLVEENKPGLILGDLNSYIINTLQFNPKYITFHMKSVFFDIDQSTKQITVKKSIDIDNLCIDYSECCDSSSAIDSQCTLMENIVVQRNGIYQEKLKLKVEIRDINDNPPKFTDKKQIIKLSENVPLYTTVTIESAIDKDYSKINRLKNYDLFDDSNTFELNYDDSEPESLQLRVIKALDYEQKNRFNCKLTACDHSRKKCAKKTLIIELIDQNDCDPKFNRDTYNIELKEDFPINKSFLKVVAVDLDSYRYNKTKYGIEGHYDIKSIFQINQYTGDLSLKRKLSVKRKLKYQFKVYAIDAFSTTHKKDYTTVTISIEDVNNNKPEISLINGKMPDTYILELRENTNPGNLFSVSVNDDDLDFNGKFNCSIMSKVRDSGFAMQMIDANIFQIFSTRMYDYERETSVRFSILCTDFGTPKLTSEKQVIINILDTNEFNPEFIKSIKTLKLRENLRENYEVYEAKAIDKDRGALLRYRLSRGSDKYFKIDETVGKVFTTHIKLDREKMSSINVTIQVTDAKLNARTATMLLIVNILDQNDNQPIFMQDLSLSVQENQHVYTKVIPRLSALDNDKEEPNNIVVFSLVCTYDSSLTAVSESLFDIAGNGEIETLSMLDREKSPNYTLTIQAKDNGVPSMSSIQNVTINILDLNDNDPNWVLKDSMASYVQLNISTMAKIGTTITRLLAVDPDLNDAGLVKYEFPSGSRVDSPLRSFLRINKTTGNVVVVNSPLPYGNHKLIVRARDNAQPHNHKDLMLIINVTIQSGSLLSGLNAAIIISMLAITGIVALFLIIAIIFIRKSPTIPKELHMASNRDIQYENDTLRTMNTMKNSEKLDKHVSLLSLNHSEINNSSQDMIYSPPLPQQYVMKANYDSLMGTFGRNANTNCNNTQAAVESSFHTYIQFANSLQHPSNTNQLGGPHQTRIRTVDSVCESIAPPSLIISPTQLNNTINQNDSDSGKGTSDLDPHSHQMMNCIGTASSSGLVGSENSAISANAINMANHNPDLDLQYRSLSFQNQYINRNPSIRSHSIQASSIPNKVPQTATLYGNIEIIPSVPPNYYPNTCHLPALSSPQHAPLPTATTTSNMSTSSSYYSIMPVINNAVHTDPCVQAHTFNKLSSANTHNYDVNNIVTSYQTLPYDK